MILIKLPVNREHRKWFKISEKIVTTKSEKCGLLAMHGFKKVRFGEKSAEKFAKDLEKNLSGDSDEKALLRYNFQFNKTLIHPSGIPQSIKENILSAYDTCEAKSNFNGIMNFFLKYSLREHMKNMGAMV